VSFANSNSTTEVFTNSDLTPTLPCSLVALGLYVLNSALVRAISFPKLSVLFSFASGEPFSLISAFHAGVSVRPYLLPFCLAELRIWQNPPQTSHLLLLFIS